MPTVFGADSGRCHPCSGLCHPFFLANSWQKGLYAASLLFQYSILLFGCQAVLLSWDKKVEDAPASSLVLFLW